MARTLRAATPTKHPHKKLGHEFSSWPVNNRKKKVPKMPEAIMARGDGAMPARRLSNKQARVWLAEHNPYADIPDTFDRVQHYFWIARFWRDQSDAVWDPKRSRLAWVQTRIILPVLGLCVLGMVVGLVLELTGVMK